MILCDVLDDRQPQPGSAGGLRPALIHPEETLEDSAEDVPRFVGMIRTEAARLVTLVDDIIKQ